MAGLSQLIDTGGAVSMPRRRLQTVANNTANVNTAGYNVESVQRPSASRPARRVGTDASIQRSYNQSSSPR